VVVRNGRFGYVGPVRKGLRWTEGPEIDLEDVLLLPGFIDCHLHLSTAIEDDPLELMAEFVSYSHFKAADRAQRTLNAGITAARDLGGIDAGFRHAIADGLIDGPRLHVAVALMSPAGGDADDRLPNGQVTDFGDDADRFARLVDTDDEMRKAVRELIHAEADVIKVCTTGGVSSPGDSPYDLGTSEQQVRI